MSSFDLRKFLSYYRPYLRVFISVMACALLVAGITLAFPLLIRYITKTVLAGERDASALRQIYLAGALMVALLLVRTGAGFYVDYRGHALGALMERDLRRELFDHYLRLPFRFYDEQRTGQLMSRLGNDLLSLAEFYHHAPEDYLIYLVKFAGALMILARINLPLTLVVVAFLPVLAVVALRVGGWMHRALRTNYERIGDLNAQVGDTLAGIRAVKSFGNEGLEARKFAHANDRFLGSRKAIYRSEAYLDQGVSLLTQLMTIAVVVFGGVAIVHASLDLADLLTFLLYIGSLIEPVQKLTHMTNQLQEGVAGFERFMELLAVEPEADDLGAPVALERVRGEVEFRDVVFRYRDDGAHVLKDLRLTVRAGEYVALVGSSGVGKTTLCSLIPRFYDVSAGAVLLDGVNVQDIELSSLRRMVGVVQQDVYLFAGTVYENIRYGRPAATRAEVIEAAKRAYAHEFIAALPQGYDTEIGERGVRLSGGQKQRLSIARVFLKDPPVLIFDEATSSLDSASERVVQESLEALAAGRTTIVIAHRLSTIRNAERIIVLTEEGIGKAGGAADYAKP